MISRLCPSLALTFVILAVPGMGYAAEPDTPYSWQKPHARVLPDGDLQWAPEPFTFTAGRSVRYIDFESGDDANDGLGKQTPWKHHPWDTNAAGAAKACTGTRGLKKGQSPPKSIYPGQKRRTVDIGTTNLLIEMVFKTELGLTGAVLVSKLSDRVGYMLDLDVAGNLRLTLRAAGADGSLTGATAVNGGKWHHVIAEVDRGAARGITIYVDGRKVDGEFAGAMPAKESSLSNTADLLLGKGPSGKLFAGAIDFLRICRGTLADTETTIEELYTWQFDGPQTRDFTGRKPADGQRDAGAIEYRE